MIYVPEEKEALLCPNNEAVFCTTHGNCYNCGWNPTVERLRKLRINEKIKEEKKNDIQR